MHPAGIILVITLVTPLALAGPRGNTFFRRTGDDDTDKDLTSTLSLTSIETFSATTSPVLVSIGQSSSVPSKDQSSTMSVSSTSDKYKDEPSSTASTSDKDKPTSTTSTLDKDTPTSSTSTSDKDDKGISSVPAKDRTTSSSVLPKTFLSTIPVTFPYGTSPSSAPESTQEIVVTDIVYTTITTCPVTNTVTSGSSEIEKVTTTISTLTLTSTSTVCTKCVAPPKSKPETASTPAGATETSSFPASVIYSLTELSPNLPSQASVSSGASFTLYSFSLPKAPLTTAPATFPGTAASSNTGFNITSLVSSDILATSTTGTLVISGYSIVPSPTRIPEGLGPFSNASSTIIPIFSAQLLGNAYGGGFVATPSVYATKLASPSGPPEGYAPGYGFSSQPETSATISEILNSIGFNVPGPVETSISGVPTSVVIPGPVETSISGVPTSVVIPGPVKTSISGVPTSVVIPGPSTIPAVGLPASVSVESSIPALSNAPISEAAAIVSSTLINGTPVSIASATPLSEGQISAAAQISSMVLTPVIGANGLTSLAVIQPPTSHTSATILTPILGTSGPSSVMVVPSPVVGENGLTSLAVFPTAIAAANGLTSPAFALTPVVGANGLTSLAVLATPIVGANGLTSLAIGLAPSAAASGNQPGIAASSLSPLPVASDVLLGSANPTSSGSGGNASVHVSFSPSPIAEFEGSARRMTLSCGAGLLSFIIFLFFL